MSGSQPDDIPVLGNTSRHLRHVIINPPAGHRPATAQARRYMDRTVPIPIVIDLSPGRVPGPARYGHSDLITSCLDDND